MRLRRQQGQAATETMLSMMFMLMMIFGSVQLCWWSMNKYLANLAAFGAARTAMVGGPANEQMLAARQLYNARGNGPGPRIVSMARTYGGGGGGGGGLGGMFNGLLNQLLQGLQGPLNLFVVPLQAQFGGLMSGLGPGSGVGNMLFQLGLPTNLTSILQNGIGGMMSSLFGGGGRGRERTGVAYIVTARGGLPIQDGVRVVGWSHVVIQPNVPESGDNAGGYYGAGGGFGALGGLGGLLGGLGNMLNSVTQILGGGGGPNINQMILQATTQLQHLFEPGGSAGGAAAPPTGQ